MKTVLAALTMVVFLAALPGPAQAQGPAADSQDQRTMGMMQMMEQMKDQMKQMHEQMMQMKEMHAQMMQMNQMHERMSGMMQEHRAQMQKGCPGAAAPDPTKKGG
jgi:TolA-binding protein